MVERMEIDALLIGSLYGELSAAEEARLNAHLESHPADRTALANITQARAAFRDSQLAARLYDPPQAVSARLLQEAARRAPKKKLEEHREERWFQRFLRSFVAHPAMAAATMLVLVLGVAGTLYLRGESQFVEKNAPGVESPALTPARPEVAQHGANGTVDQGGYRVDLAEAPNDAAAVAATADQPEQSKLGGKGGGDGAASNEQTRAQFGGNATASTDHYALDKEKAKPDPKRTPYLEVQTEHRTVKDLDDKDEAQKNLKQEGAAKQQVGQDQQGEDRTHDATVAQRGAGGAPAGAGAAPGIVTGGAPAAAPSAGDVAPADPAATAATRQAPPRVTAKPPVTPAPTVTLSGRNVENDKLRTPATTTPAAPPAAGAGSAAVARDTREKSAEERMNDETVLAWARARHAELQTAVKNNQCQAAANLALDLSTRVPGYYAQNVEGDRLIKQCAPYIARVREADAEKRARLKRGDESRSSRPADAKAPAPASNK